MLCRSGVALALVATCLLAGCTAVQDSPDDEARPINTALQVDERRGAFRGVAIGDRRSAVRRRLGKSRAEPGVLRQGGAVVPVLPGGDFLAYRGVEYGLEEGVVSYVVVHAEGASTSGGIRIGDPLSEVRSAYPRARCETAEGFDPPRDAYCMTQTGRCRWLWLGSGGGLLGANTIDTIVVAIDPPTGDDRVGCSKQAEAVRKTFAP